MNSSAFVAYPVHAVLLNFSKIYKMWLIESRHSTVVFLPVETEKSESITDGDNAKPQKSCTDTPRPGDLVLKNRYKRRQVRTGGRGRRLFCTDLCARFWTTWSPAILQDLVLEGGKIWN